MSKQKVERKQLAEVKTTRIKRMMDQLEEASIANPANQREEGGEWTFVGDEDCETHKVDDIEVYLMTFKHLMTGIQFHQTF